MGALNFKKPLYLLLAGVILYLGIFCLETFLPHYYDFDHDVDSFRKVLREKEAELDDIIADFGEQIKGQDIRYFSYKRIDACKELYEDKGIAIYIYDNDTLKFWSNNFIPVPDHYKKSLFNKNAAYLENAWYLISVSDSGDKKVVGLSLIKSRYSYENEFLVNEFSKDYNFHSSFEISLFPSNNSYIINANNGNFLFYLTPSGNRVSASGYFIIPFLYCLLLICLLFFMYYTVQSLNGFFRTNWWLPALLLDIVIVRYLMIRFSFPDALYDLDLFSPQYYAGSFWFASLGDFLLNAIFLLFFSFTFFRYFSLPSAISVRKNLSLALLIILILITGFVYMCLYYLFKNLIFNSSILFEVYKVFDLNIYSFTGFIIIAFLLASFIFITDRIIAVATNLADYRKFLIIAVIVYVVFYAVMIPAGYITDIFSILFFLLLIYLISKARYRPKGYQYSYKVVILFIVSVFTVYFVTDNTNSKEREIRKTKAVSLATERDPIAELLLEEIEGRMREDRVLDEHFSRQQADKEKITEYLLSNYFYGYFKKYDVEIIFCENTEGIDPDNKISNCEGYFGEITDNIGFRLKPTSGYYFLDNSNGSISYLGSYKYRGITEQEDYLMYFILDSRLMSEELGYPELLLDDKLRKESVITDYSYAKYNNGRLVTQSGDFSYSLTTDIYDYPEDRKFFFLSFDGYSHLIYNIDKENLILLSKPLLKPLDILISFSYIFLIFYLLLTIGLAAGNPNLPEQYLAVTFKDRIKISLVSVLILSLLLIGGSTVYYNIKQYQDTQYEQISEKKQSVLIELEHKLATEEELTPELYEYVHTYLLKFSNVFYSDINLYDLDGNLYASSRTEIFDKGLIGTRMDPEAYLQVAINKKPKFVHKEKIGRLSYLSAYAPFRNEENKLLAYLNLPYFTKQSFIQKEITGLVAAIINIYVILILLAIVVAVFISTRITQPLRLIQERFREIQLGRKNEPIEYAGRDEIGSLINEYNRMVVELSESVELLAKSERESAWREMARQIAHEIKNPLTPMRLNVQLLERLWRDKDPDFEERLVKVARSLIDQIDTLSTIANEFSNFAKMPKASNEPVNIITKIRNSVNLFEDTENVTIDIYLNDISEAWVFADKEQVISIFNNLIKNAIQSIPEEHEGKINISVSKTDSSVTIEIRDNGTGIPDEMRDKLFEPNFTTKTSGMGLGLAITRNIIESCQGSIWFETELGKGTTFYVELPLTEV